RDVGQHRDAAVRCLQRNLRHLQLFFQRQGAGLAERAASHQAVDAVADLEVDVARGALGIDRLIGVELGGDGGKDALPTGLGHLSAPWRMGANTLARYERYLARAPKGLRRSGACRAATMAACRLTSTPPSPAGSVAA